MTDPNNPWGRWVPNNYPSVNNPPHPNYGHIFHPNPAGPVAPWLESTYDNIHIARQPAFAPYGEPAVVPGAPPSAQNGYLMPMATLPSQENASPFIPERPGPHPQHQPAQFYQPIAHAAHLPRLPGDPRYASSAHSGIALQSSTSASTYQHTPGTTYQRPATYGWIEQTRIPAQGPNQPAVVFNIPLNVYQGPVTYYPPKPPGT
jgi:hypothetical protein